MITLVGTGVIDNCTAMDYSKFQVEDFVSDEYFIKWVKKPDAGTTAFWNAWMSKNPQATDRIRQAREIVQQLDIKPIAPPEGKFLEVWDKIVKAELGDVRSMPFLMPNAIEAKRSINKRKRIIYSIAASLALIFVCGWIFINVKSRKIEISTRYGESRTLLLPDSSKVTLNSNSRISYSTALLSSSNREVFLEGEAYFSVVHKDSHEKFTVRTGELNVEVLGTKFNVNSRRGNTKVILEEGKVRLNMPGGSKKDLIMVPGEFVEYSTKGQLTQRKVDVNNYLEWRNNRLIFVGTSLQEIGQLLEDNYGYKVMFESDSIKQRKFTGSSSAIEIEELLDKLSRVYNLDVKQNGNEITLKQNKDAPLGVE